MRKIRTAKAMVLVGITIVFVAKNAGVNDHKHNRSTKQLLVRVTMAVDHNGNIINSIYFSLAPQFQRDVSVLAGLGFRF